MLFIRMLINKYKQPPDEDTGLYLHSPDLR
jgi:hypothetical protein